jgi:transposase InsO family protein
MAHRSHPRAKLTVEGRLLLVHRVLDLGWPRARAAEAQGCSGATAGKWVRRFAEEGIEGLHDRGSRPRTSPTRLSAEVEQQILDYRSKHRVGAHQISFALGIPQSTVSAVLARRRVPLLRHLDRPTGAVVRYERDRPGELVHIDVKKQGRIPDGGGWRLHGRGPGVGQCHDQRGRKGSGAKLGYDFCHVAVDDHSRVAYAEVHDNERGDTAAGFLQRAVAWFADHGVAVQRVLTDNGSCYRSGAFRQTADALDVTLKKTRPYRPQTNGKVERFNCTLKLEWAWARPYTSNAERTLALGAFLHRYNHHRRHLGIKGGTPMSRLDLNDLPGNHI